MDLAIRDAGSWASAGVKSSPTDNRMCSLSTKAIPPPMWQQLLNGVMVSKMTVSLAGDALFPACVKRDTRFLLLSVL
jgi:hypothetical protein